MATTATNDRGYGRTRHIRVRDELWSRAYQRAQDQGFRMSDVIRVLLHRYANGEIDI
jgi:antitoxin component of RelBE/YafQ-DinJ toxin-antitoxin module